MKRQFTYENTDGYTATQLAELNHRYDDRTKGIDEDDSKGVAEQVWKEFERELTNKDGTGITAERNYQEAGYIAYDFIATNDRAVAEARFPQAAAIARSGEGYYAFATFDGYRDWLNETNGSVLRRKADALKIPLSTLDKVKRVLAEARLAGSDKSFARLMLKHGRMTDEARSYVSTYRFA